MRPARRRPAALIAATAAALAGTVGGLVAASPLSGAVTATPVPEAVQVTQERQARLVAARTAVLAAAVERRNQQLAADRAARAGEERRRQRAQEREQRRIERMGYRPGTTDPREIGRQIAASRFDWTGRQFSCFDKLIKSESQWRVRATNPSSGAYGIPQSLPGNKMATVAADWRTNPATQIVWGLRYVRDVYGTPCAAWSFKQGNNWY